MNSYRQTLNFLYGLQQRGMKFGLRNIRTLLRSAGEPQHAYPSIHIAGTNGKGSTASFLASVFIEAGYRTALYTSPHLVRFTERIKINGHEIPEALLVQYARLLRPTIEATKATFFEATTCIAFRFFADQHVDIAIVETGLGGRLDATNLLAPEVSVITPIGYDHMEYLGTTLRSIAREKGGIIKNGVPVVTSSEEPVVLETLRKIAVRRKSHLYTARAVVRIPLHRRFRKADVTVRSKIFGTVRVHPGLEGEHQIENARLAIAVLDVLLRQRMDRERFGRITAGSVRQGLSRVVANTGLRGRMETIGGRFIVDVAHNPTGIQTLARALRKQGRPVGAIVFGAMKDKDWESMLRELAPLAERWIMVTPRTSRALPAGTLCRRAKEMGVLALNGAGVKKGIARARRMAGKHGRILITGSHYVAGEAIACLEGPGA